jgi:lambda family phage portal protein
MGWLDKTIAAVSPVWAARRAQARLELQAAGVRSEMISQLHPQGHYLDAARRDRTSADWPQTAVSADGGIIGDLSLANARSRAAVWNDWAARSGVGVYRRHVVGIGITPRSAARDPESGEETAPFERFNRRIDALYDWWAHRPWLCDYERTKNLCEIDGLAVSDFAQVGEAFCIHSFTPVPNMVGMQIQMFEVEQLDWTLTRNADNGKEIRGGIEIDRSGVAVAFWLFTDQHPLDGNFWAGRGRGGTGGSVRISADRVYHVIRQERVRQTHGVGQFAAVLEDVYQLKGYKQAEAVGKRLDACIGLKKRYESWYQGDGTGYPGLGVTQPSGRSTTDARGNAKVRFEPGMIADPGPGMYYESHVSNRPGAQYEQYVSRQTDQIAAGAGVDAAHLTRNFNQGTYTSQRQGALELDREMDPIQTNLIIDQWARPRREAFKLYAVLQGLVEAPGMFDDPWLTMAYLSEDWSGPPKPWVDPRNQAQATQIALEAGLTDLRREKNILGGDWREAIDQRASEQARAQAKGVKLSWLSGKASPAPAAAAVRPANPDSTAEDAEDAEREQEEEDEGRRS